MVDYAVTVPSSHEIPICSLYRCVSCSSNNYYCICLNMRYVRYNELLTQHIRSGSGCGCTEAIEEYIRIYSVNA